MRAPRIGSKLWPCVSIALNWTPGDSVFKHTLSNHVSGGKFHLGRLNSIYNTWKHVHVNYVIWYLGVAHNTKSSWFERITHLEKKIID